MVSSPNRDHQPPAFLLGGIDLLRALMLASIPVVLATTRSDIALWSRAVKESLLLPPPGDGTTLDRLLHAGKALRGRFGTRLPLIYGSDDWLTFIYAHKRSLEPYFSFLANDPALGEALLDKERFSALARSKKLPVPASFRWSEDPDDPLLRHRGPVIAKPKLKHEDAPEVRRLLGERGKGKIYPNSAAMLADARLRPFRDALMIQAYIPGGSDRIFSFHGFASEDSRTLAWFVGRKIRTFPSLTGESSFLELVQHEGLGNLGLGLVQALGLQGPFKMDFKQDESDGRFYLLEINARFTLWNYLGAVNGINLVSVAYDYLQAGAEPRPTGYRTQYKWLDLPLDYKAFRELRADGAMTLAAWLRSLLLEPSVRAFRWNDPGPSLKWWLDFISRRMPRWRSTAS
jgi:predicted ATP-grasp superfamily ATP-dependent carboligase